ncbi:RluA family pseudouridine synthase [Aquibacillus kalidii]|uniref:RluA family pseudouridine synthase n=1 Tax=Aquibacillus kalidii TaxID=2762597 RepID=UPI0016445127|nr:RluA family pseudouridine synthase [Aquibacillus kalidii]
MKQGHNKGSKHNQKVEEFRVNERIELLPYLLEVLSNRSRNSVKSMLTRGQVLVDNQIQTLHNLQLAPGQLVTIRKYKIVEKTEFKGITILHEDEDIIVINKESGLLSIASEKEKQLTAYRQLMNHVKHQNPKNRIYIVHRLDRDTSGVMMFAKNEKTKKKLQDNWKDTVNERKYVALVEGKVQKLEGTISSWLVEGKNHKVYSKQHAPDGKHAVTHYKVLQSNSKYSLLEVELETGRKNQIRVHMQDLGHSIVGDKKYGSKSNPIGRLGLHAQVLAFTHPTTKKSLKFMTEIPKVFFGTSK